MICLAAMLINLTTVPFNTTDLNNFKSAQRVCESRYEGCIKSFQKRDVRTYRVLCGEKVAFDKKELYKAEKDAIMDELSHLSEEDRNKLLKEIGE